MVGGGESGEEWEAEDGDGDFGAEDKWWALEFGVCVV